MKLSQTCLLATAIGVSLASLGLVAQDQRIPSASKSLLRVGVYDSRAVAIAYAGSKIHNDFLKQKMTERDQAKADGNQAKVDELEAWGQAHQAHLHQQGFGTTPVADMLTHIKDQLPQIAAEAGVDLIVSKWQLDYTRPEADLVDITLKIIQPFEPQEKTLKWIEQLKDHPPLSPGEIESHEH